MTTLPTLLPSWTPRSKRFGQGTLVGAVALLLASLVAAVLIGAITAPVTTSGMSFELDATSSDPAKRAAAIAAIAHIIIGTVVGIGTIAIGILAVLSRRGLVYGAAAIVIAALTPGFSLFAFIVATSLSWQA
jgi:hypothetical protein